MHELDLGSLASCVRQANESRGSRKGACAFRGLAVKKECSNVWSAYSEKGVFMYLEAVGGVSDLEQHGAHGGAEACPDHHCQHFIL